MGPFHNDGSDAIAAPVFDMELADVPLDVLAASLASFHDQHEQIEREMDQIKESINRMLGNYFIIQDVARDGNCGFNAIAHQLMYIHNQPVTRNQLRLHVCRRLRESNAVIHV